MKNTLLRNDFSGARSWVSAVSERGDIPAMPAVYVICSDKKIGRLHGENEILYVGATGELGGKTDRCRLRTYCYPSNHHDREIKRRTNLLINLGGILTLQWKTVSTRKEALDLEANILADYLNEHGELPPFNGRV